jgi:hypothetical protein
VQYRIQYLDGSANIIRELSADARSGMSAFELVADMAWAPRAVAMRVLDADGREVHSAIRGDAPEGDSRADSPASPWLGKPKPVAPVCISAKDDAVDGRSAQMAAIPPQRGEWIKSTLC